MVYPKAFMSGGLSTISMESILYVKEFLVDGVDKSIFGKIPVSAILANEGKTYRATSVILNGEAKNEVVSESLSDFLNYVKSIADLSYVFLDDYELVLLKAATFMLGLPTETHVGDSLVTTLPTSSNVLIQLESKLSSLEVGLKSGTKVSLNDDQVVKLDNSVRVKLDESVKVKLDDNQYVNLNSNQKVDLNEGQSVVLSKDQFVHLYPSDVVKLDDNQQVHLYEGDTVTLAENQKVHLYDDDVVKLADDQKVHLYDNDTVTLKEGSKVLLESSEKVDFTSTLNSWSTNLTNIAATTVENYTKDALVQNDLQGLQSELASFSENLISTIDKIQETTDLYNNLRDDYSKIVSQQTSLGTANGVMNGINLILNAKAAYDAYKVKSTTPNSRGL